MGRSTTAWLAGTARYVGQLLLVLVGATFLVSMLLRLLPVGLEELYVTAFDEAGRQAQIRELGLDKGPISFYLSWFVDILRGDFGWYVSAGFKSEPVSAYLWPALRVSLLLILYVQVVALAVAVPLGVYTAFRAGTKKDKVISYGLFTAASIPNFVFGLVLALVVGVWLGWLPPLDYVAPGDGLVDHFRHVALPVLSLAIPLIATYTRILRVDVIAALREDFVTMAVSKGLSTRRILWTHVLRPSSVTLLTSAALNMGALIGGTLVIETIFTIPGMGSELGRAIFSRQYFAVQSYIAVIAIGYVFFNAIVDVAIGFVDPRARDRRAR
ncbi:MAG: ABC transporter permease [Acidimicrobiia bacterium]